MKSLTLAHGTLELPVFLPDATQGVVRSAGADDLERAGVQALVMNVFHLMQKPGSSIIQGLGGLHAMSGWSRPIITDSGGFQAYSLVRQNPKFGSLSDQGVRFKPEGADRDYLLTPEKSVQLQMAYGADVVICLDDCTHSEDAPIEQRLSVERTLLWAKRCKREFEKQIAQRKLKPEAQPKIFAVVQGGSDVALRTLCAEGLLEIGFHGYGFGGWPLDSEGKLLESTLALVRSLIPREYPMHALGVGHPESVRRCVEIGYEIFDCALPTRDARNGRLFVWKTDPENPYFEPSGGWFDRLYIDDEKHMKSRKPISEYCDCPLCSRYSTGYLRHLHKCGDTLYFRLATLHNLRFMMQLMRSLGRKGDSSL